MADDQTSEEREILRGVQQQRRRRRRRRWLIVLGIVMAVVCVTLLAAFAYDLYWQDRLKARDAQLLAQGKLLPGREVLARGKGLPDDKNSALVYLDAFKQMQLRDGYWVLTTLLSRNRLGTRPSQGTLGLIGAEAEANSAAFETMLRASSLEEGCYPRPTEPLTPDEGIGYLEHLRRAAILCGDAAVLHAATGQPKQSVPYLMAGLGLSLSVGREPVLIEVLVRAASDAIATWYLERSLALCQFEPSDLQALQKLLEREREELSLDKAMSFERSLAHSQFKELVAAAKSAAFPKGLPRFYGLVPGWRERDELFYADALDELQRIVALPPRQALSQMGQFEAGPANTPSNAFPHPVVGPILLDGYPRCLEHEVLAKVQLSVAAAGLAAERYRLKNGRWPASLDVLVPEFLVAVPEDYFGTGKLHYVRTERGVTVYSVGEDGLDDGGVSLDEAQSAASAASNDLPFRMLSPELRGAKTMAFRDEVRGAHLSLKDLQAAGLDEAALKRLGLTEEELKGLR